MVYFEKGEGRDTNLALLHLGDLTGLQDLLGLF
jgi:hypothetical protein